MACPDAIDHRPRGADLGLPDRALRLDVHDDGVVGVDEVVVAGVGEHRRPLLGRRPLAGGIGVRHELGLGRTGRAEIRVIEGLEILPDRARCFLGVDAARIPLRLGTGVQLVHVRHDQARVDGEPGAADQTLLDAALHHALEDQPQQVAVAELAVPVLREGRNGRAPGRRGRPGRTIGAPGSSGPRRRAGARSGCPSGIRPAASARSAQGR